MNPTMNAIDIVVSDLDAAIAFYRLLGPEFEKDPHMPEHAQCDSPGGLHVGADQAWEASPSAKAANLPATCSGRSAVVITSRLDLANEACRRAGRSAGHRRGADGRPSSSQ